MQYLFALGRLDDNLTKIRLYGDNEFNDRSILNYSIKFMIDSKRFNESLF